MGVVKGYFEYLSTLKLVLLLVVIGGVFGGVLLHLFIVVLRRKAVDRV